MNPKNYKLSEQQKREIEESIIRILCKDSRIIFAYIFGSFLSSESIKDIDIALYIEKEIDSNLSLKLELELERIIQDKVRIPVDVRILNFSPLTFSFNVVKNGKVIIDKNSFLRSDFESLIFRKYFDFKHLSDEYLREVKNAPL
ncbi:MAG: nucleotidyltransferase domain-containing protein [Candidatus Schekmanbacteria bacterium]|nr:MAG: nucleotidyltransferase domain-containing protein [Candidatus Schekmanbacteria bacterium]